MKNYPRFNYIITIHNKENIIEKVLESVLMCCRDNSYIYTIIDGCTDNTEKIIDEVIKKYDSVPINKIYAPDVHELLSINIGLRASNQEGQGYNIVLQDDVIFADFKLEEKIIKLYEWGGDKLGYVSLRVGANLKDDTLLSDEINPQYEYVENAYGHGLSDAEILLPGRFVYRDIAIKSPVCLPFQLVRKIGMLDEKLAPYGHDDLEYGLRCYKFGYKNGAFGIKFYSDLKWGGTRATHHPELTKIIKRNINNIREWYREDIELLIKNRKKDFKIYEIPELTDIKQDKVAIFEWENNKQNLLKFKKENTPKLLIVKSAIFNLGKKYFKIKH